MLGGLAGAAAVVLPFRAPRAAVDASLAGRALQAAYPEDIVEIAGNEAVFASGQRMLIDDGRDKSFEQRLSDTDLQDIFHDPYPWDAPADPPGHNVDPGRYRPDALFRALYGATQGDVTAKLTSVTWLANTRPSTLQVHRKYDIPARLARISARLEALGTDYLPYLEAPGGTFNWRVIAGTERLSAHSFGISIDINTGYADYWRWAGGGPDPSEYRNRIPAEIVAAFEAEDFIWGGRWYHYDTMHFEYRPELRQVQRLTTSP